jgi:hypothetical protein
MQVLVLHVVLADSVLNELVGHGLGRAAAVEEIRKLSLCANNAGSQNPGKSLVSPRLPHV